MSRCGGKYIPSSKVRRSCDHPPKRFPLGHATCWCHNEWGMAPKARPRDKQGLRFFFALPPIKVWRHLLANTEFSFATSPNTSHPGLSHPAAHHAQAVVA